MEKILVFEDNPVYIETAKKFFRKHPELEVVFASTYEEAEKAIQQGIDGALLDVFAPAPLPIGRKALQVLQKPEQYPRSGLEIYRKSLDAIASELNKEAPVGVLLALQMEKTPFVLTTDYYHHATKAQCIFDFKRGKYWEVCEGYKGEHITLGRRIGPVDACDGFKKEKEEYWSRAWDLLKQAKKKKKKS